MERNLTSDDLTAEEAKALMAAGVEAAENVGVTSTVEEGMYNDGFRIDEEGATTSTGPNSVMQSTLELAAAAPLAINRILMNDVRKRLGDIRTSQGKSGVWARYDGGRLSGSAGLENDFHTIQAGVDTVPVRFGAALSYTGSEADYRRGNADMDLYGLSAYGLWMGEAGQFVDVVGRLASVKTDMTVDGGQEGFDGQRGAEPLGRVRLALRRLEPLLCRASGRGHVHVRRCRAPGAQRRLEL